MKKRKLFIIIGFITSLTLANHALAASFNPNFIISDEEMFDYNSMSWADIQNFLNNKEGILKNLIIESAPDDNGNPGKRMEATSIIYLAAKKWKINPKLILAKIQHESSLITDPDPKDIRLTWATGYAVCDSCNIWDPQVAIFGGFGQQVDYLARILRKYTDKPELYNFQVGDTYTFKDKVGNVNPPYEKKQLDTKVTFSNIATKNLYTYTPHVYTYFYEDDETGQTNYVGGNFNFWRIWNGWFGKSYPDGSLLQIKENDGLATKEEKQVVWIIRNNKRRSFQSKTALISNYNPDKILYVDKKELDNYEIGNPIKYPNYSILRGPDKQTYLIVDDAKRLISSEKIFKNIGFNPEEVVDVEQTDLELYRSGNPLTEYSIYPTGALLQNKITSGIYYVESSLKQPIAAKEILLSNFPNKKIISVSPEELDKYLTGKPLKFKDGDLVTAQGNPTVYVISNGFRRPITSAKTFENLGYKWSNIITTTQEAVELHPLGDVLGE
ncbi:MAG: hypothetical protein ABIC82_06315 [bacterium]